MRGTGSRRRTARSSPVSSCSAFSAERLVRAARWLPMHTEAGEGRTVVLEGTREAFRTLADEIQFDAAIERKKARRRQLQSLVRAR